MWWTDSKRDRTINILWSTALVLINRQDSGKFSTSKHKLRITILTAVEVQNVQNSGSRETFTSNRQQQTQCRQIRRSIKSERNPPPPLCPFSVPDVTDLSGISRAALPSPARATAFELLLAVMFISNPATRLMNKHMKSFLEERVKDLRLNCATVWPVQLTLHHWDSLEYHSWAKTFCTFQWKVAKLNDFSEKSSQSSTQFY